MIAFLARFALLEEGWREHVRIETDGAGTIVRIVTGAARGDAVLLDGAAVPGIVNAHCHAFQRAFAGEAERRGGDDDTFWTWREAMYAALERLTPATYEAIATDLYRAARARGYTHVVEFHYVHHDRDGRPYPRAGALADAIVASARRAGVGLTLLPVFYAHGAAGGAPPAHGQRRFVMDVEAFIAYRDALARAHPQIRVGVAPHSLRAATPDEIVAVTAAAQRADAAMPVHMHLAEQPREIEEVLAAHGMRPLAALHAAVSPGPAWSFVHGTHLDGEEIAAIAASGATIVLCPTTEGNLGDGIFPAEEVLRHGGSLAIGSDSNVGIDPAEELRWMEYVRRLATGRRAVLASAEVPSVAETLVRSVAAGGARSAANGGGAIAQGRRCDLVVLAAGDDPGAALDRWIFVDGPAAVVTTVAGGAAA